MSVFASNVGFSLAVSWVFHIMRDLACLLLTTRYYIGQITCASPVLLLCKISRGATAEPGSAATGQAGRGAAAQAGSGAVSRGLVVAEIEQQ